MKQFKLVALSALCALAFSAQAQQVITTAGGVSVGVQANGALGIGSIGITLAGPGDGITPGCLCEGWGASLGSVTGWSANSAGVSNITGQSFVSTATSATSVVNVGSSLSVTQAYTLSASDSLVKNHVTLTNLTGTAAEVRYSRAMDWDIPPTEFSELVTIQGVGATRLIYSNDNGFAAPNPLVNPEAIVSGTINADVVDSGPSDHGAFFTFSFGTLAAGESVSFDIYYGAARSESAALAALGDVGAEVYSFGQSRGNGATGEPGTYIFGFAGVGGTALPPVTAVPEPETYALMLAGLGLVGWMARRRKAA